MEPAGVVDRGVVVAPAGLEQEDARAPLVDEAARDDGAGGPGADDDDVGVVLAHGRLASVMGTTLEPLPVPCHVAPTRDQATQATSGISISWGLRPPC